MSLYRYRAFDMRVLGKVDVAWLLKYESLRKSGCSLAFEI